MKAILKENQNKFSFKLGPEETAKSGNKMKMLYLFGDFRLLNDQIKRDGADKISTLITKIIDYKWAGVKMFNGDWVVWMRLFQNRSTGEYNIEDAKQKLKPYIDKVNNFYKYTLDIDKLIGELEDYVPVKQPEDPDAPQVATNEETMEIVRRLENFKDNLLRLSSSEELQKTMRLILTVKGAGKYKYTFSPRNSIAIKTQRPDATFVGNKNNWKNFWNRTIKPDAKPIFVYAPLVHSFSPEVEKDYLMKVGKKKTQLSSFEQAELYNLQGNRKKTGDNSYKAGHWIANYDVKDTVQITGTDDILSVGLETAEKAKSELGDRNLGDIDTDTQTTSDEKIIKPVYDGLIAYSKAQDIVTNTTGANDVSASSTKLLALALLNKIISGNIPGVASKTSIEAKSPAARRQQAELASWQFMDAFGVKYNLADIDMNVIFGAPEDGKDYQRQKNKQKWQINNVLMDISNAVNHLIDFVNKDIKANAKLNEIEGGIPQGKHVTPNDIANTLGVSDMINEQVLYERLRKRINLI